MKCFKAGRLGGWVILLACISAIAGCAGGGSSRGGRAGPYSPYTESDRDTHEAQRLTRQAAEMMDADAAKAESLLRGALTADLYHGPAHNNLGVLFLKQDRLYEAAGEFSWAGRLMPGHPDPRMNLALTLETAGKTDEAIDAYRTALAVYPEHLPSMQALARLQVRSGRADDQTPRLLREVAFRSEDSAWRDWARRLLALRYGSEPQSR